MAAAALAQHLRRAKHAPGGQGDYDLCIAVDPNNANRIYVGGDYFAVSPWPGNIQRCIVAFSAGAYSMTALHRHQRPRRRPRPGLRPGRLERLYTGTDGGCFLNSDPAGSGEFESRNTGLSCLCTNYIA